MELSAEKASAARDQAPYRAVEFLPVDLNITRRADGSLIIASNVPLSSYEKVLPHILAKQAIAKGDQSYLVQRQGRLRDWAHLSYRTFKQQSDAVGQWLLDQKLPEGATALILSGNSLAHAVFKFGAFGAGVPVCPVSVNYGMTGSDFGRLAHVIHLIKPALIFIEDAAPFARALANVDFGAARIISATPGAVGPGAIDWADVLATKPKAAIADHIAQLSPKATAAYMLTSGSTGRPKAVIQTHEMIAANVAQAIQTMGKAAGWDGPMLDWLPWNHVSGATAPLLALAAGGTLYIDEGKPMPGLFDESLRNLRDVPVSYYVNVPLGYAMLADALAADESLRQHFFKHLRIMLYGGAGLPQPLLDRLQDMAVATIGHKILGSSAYGATETTSGFMAIHYLTDKVGIGLPMPGVEIKLVPHGPRYELRARGPITTPGYLGEPEKSASMFDEEGFYCLGDYATFIDADNPSRGLAFAGRLAEEFKLLSGTWVRGGALKADLIKLLSPHVADLVICGDGQDRLGVLLWPSPSGREMETDQAGSLAHALRERFAEHNRNHPGQSTSIPRFIILDEPPQVDAHEISDKGTINRSAVIERRQHAVLDLYAKSPSPTVIVV
jgi:feruloyl-CoA synthase